jgi:hypothetical protein
VRWNAWVHDDHSLRQLHSIQNLELSPIGWTRAAHAGVESFGDVRPRFTLQPFSALRPMAQPSPGLVQAGIQLPEYLPQFRSESPIELLPAPSLANNGEEQPLSISTTTSLEPAR